MAELLFIFMLIVGYLVGSISSAVIVARIFVLPDPRLKGSKNPGATNVLRLAGKRYAGIVLICDMLKGFLPVILAQLLGLNIFFMAWVGLASVLGHMYPIFFNFKGGKGVATALGAFLGLHILFGAVIIIVWLVVANFSHYSSLASVIAILLAPIYSLHAFRGLHVFTPLFIMAILIIYQHRNNITRLFDGTESRINFSAVHETATGITNEAEEINPPKRRFKIGRNKKKTKK